MFLLCTVVKMRGVAHLFIVLGCAIWLAWSGNITTDDNNILGEVTPRLVRCTQHITIDTNGSDSSSCGVESSPCRSLDYTITDRLDRTCKEITLSIRNGSYLYSINGSNKSNTSHQFNNFSQLSIIGADTEVECSPGAGFAFFNCNVTITSIKFFHCGSLQPSTSTASSSANETLSVSAALYFAFCMNVTLSHVHVSHSVTSGVVMYNTKSLLVEDSHFVNNSVTNDPEKLSNGGFYVEFCYCDPGVVHDNCIPHNNTGAIYVFRSSHFFKNNALYLNTNDKLNRTYYIPYKTDYFSFGRGGGLSIVLKGNASDNSIIVDDCVLSENRALWGGGVFVEFEDNSNNNRIMFNNTDFMLNYVVNDSPTNGTGGGGARVDFLYFNESLDNSHNNSVTFDGCTFFGNSANHGGGLSLLTTPENLKSPTNTLTLRRCEFTKNDASIGAAMDLSTWHSLKTGLPAAVVIQDCNFTSNGLNNTDGTVYVDCVPPVFHGNVTFQNNSAAGLSVFGTGVTFYDDCQAQFLYNQGWTGGAISLLGNAYVSVSPGVNLTFLNNSAFVKGGAIYALLTSRRDILSSRNCFLQYKTDTLHPNDWDVNFVFINNTAPIGHSIYTTSLLPCVWGASYGNIDYNLERVLNWTNVFSYTPDNYLQISSGIASLLPNTQSSVDMEVAPGNTSQLPVKPLDDGHHDTQGSVWLYSSNRQVTVNTKLTADYKVAFYGHPGYSSQVVVLTDSARNVSVTVNMMLQQCPPGYKWNQDEKKCECGYEDWDGILYCDDVSFTSYLIRGFWAGYVSSDNYYVKANESSLVTVRCPSQYCSNIHTTFRRQLPYTANNTQMDHMICGPQNRTGVLCGNCTDDHGVAINVRSFQFNCINCSSTKYSWLVYVSSEFVPLTIFCLVILFFDINIHSGVTSSIILYFQVFDALRIVSNDELPPPPHSSGLIKAIQFLYNIWNLQFFGSLLSPYCLASRLNTMDILLINYASALFPFLLFFIVYLLNNLSFDCWSQSERLSKLRHRFRRCWYHLKWRVAVKKSILSGLATIWTLTYTRLALISFLILSRTSLNKHHPVATYQGTLPFFKGKHLEYAIPANVISTLFVFLPATGLLCYPLIPQLMGKLRWWINLDDYRLYYRASWWLERPFIRLKPIIDCLQGSYKPRREFFAGLLFWYRLVIFIVFAYSVQSNTYFWNIVFSLIFLVIVGIAQPFKKSRDNTVMLLSVANIIMISVLNIYLLDHYHGKRESAYDPTVLQWWQLALVMLPLIFIIFYSLWKINKKVQAWRKGVPAEGLYVNFSSTYEEVPADDPLLNFPAQIWEESIRADSDQDNGHREWSSTRNESSNSPRHDGHCSLQQSSNTREGSNSRSQSDVDRRRSHTCSGTLNTSQYGAINDESDQK